MHSYIELLLGSIPSSFICPRTHADEASDEHTRTRVADDIPVPDPLSAWENNAVNIQFGILICRCQYLALQKPLRKLIALRL